MIDKFSQVLDDEHINQVVYVDDKFNIDIYKVGVQTLFMERGGNEIPFPEGWKEGVPVEQQFEGWWGSAPATQIMDIVNHFNVQSDTFSVSNIIPKGKLKMLTPEQFKESYTTDVIGQFNHDNKLLLLMDRELGDDGRKGDELLEDYVSNSSIYCTIFSETFKIDDELNLWKENDFKNGIYPLSKERQENQEDLIKGLRNVLWMKHILEMKQSVEANFSVAVKNVFESTKQLDPYAFDNAVMATSEIEGSWEYDAMQRLYLIQLDTELRNIAKGKYDDLQQSISSLRNINNVVKRDISTSDYLLKLRENEIFIDGDYLNRTFSPVDNGDIYKIDNKEYMLLAQPCNLALRTNGTRKTNIAYLLPLMKVEKKEQKKFCPYREYLQYQEGKLVYAVTLSEAIPVNVSVFDLASFNNAGESKIDCSDVEIHSSCQPNLKLRHSIVKEEFNGMLALYASATEQKAKEHLNNQLKELYFVTPTVSGTNVEFGFKRVKRYRPLFAQVLLTQLNNYLSRTGFLPDFADKKNIKVEEPAKTQEG